MSQSAFRLLIEVFSRLGEITARPIAGELTESLSKALSLNRQHWDIPEHYMPLLDGFRDY